MRTQSLTLTAVALVSLLTTACASSPEVRELAETTASNASVVDSELAAFAVITRRIAEQRADAVARLRGSVEKEKARSLAFVEGARATAAIAGQSKKPNFGTLANELRRVADAIGERQQSGSETREAARTAVLASQEDLALPKEQLKTISQNLAELAEEPSRDDQIEILKGFFTQVVKEIQDAKATAESSSGTTP